MNMLKIIKEEIVIVETIMQARNYRKVALNNIFIVEIDLVFIEIE